MKRTEPTIPFQKFRNCLISSITCAFSIYWMYICCEEHWRRAVGCQNLILLLFVALFSFLSVLFQFQDKKVLYIILSVLSLVASLIVCYLNRYAKYPDFVQLIDSFDAGHPNDPSTQAFQLIYSIQFQKYSYIVDRSSSSATFLLICFVIWFCFLIRDIIKQSKRN